MTRSVPDICDRFPDRLQVAVPLFNCYGNRRRFCGQVATVKCFEDNSLVRASLAAGGGGRVLVVDGGGSLRCALVGDVLAAMAVQNGWRGIVINGCVRDVEILASIELGILALNRNPLRSGKRNEGQTDIPVHFAGVAFAPGNFVYADENGIVVADRDLGIEFD